MSTGVGKQPLLLLSKLRRMVIGRSPERPLCIAQALPLAPQAGLELFSAF